MGDLGACSNGPSIGKAAIGAAGGAAASIGSSLAAAGAISAVAGAVTMGIGAVVGLIPLFFGQTSKCAKQSPDPETFLKCWGHPVPNDFIPEWDPDKCGWFRWVKCPGAIAGHYPAAGCGPCDNPPGGQTGFSGGLWTCWQGTEVAPGVPAWGNQAAQANTIQVTDPTTGQQVTVDATTGQVVSTGPSASTIALVVGSGFVGLLLLQRLRN